MSSSSTPSTAPAAKRSWREALLIYLQPASLRMLFLGFSAGLPLLLVLGTLSFRLREAGVDRGTIGHLSWVGLAYGFKWVWAPLVDRLPIPPLTWLLGRRRGWLLVAQGMVIAGLVGMALTDPQRGLEAMVWCALLVAFGSATQDIALDAFRIESADASKQAALAASYQTGYRIAMIWAGAGVLWVASWAEVSGGGYQNTAWRMAYLVMAASMAVGVVTVLLSPEPAPVDRARQLAAAQDMRAHVRRDGVSLWGVLLALSTIPGLAALVRFSLSSTPVTLPGVALTVLGLIAYAAVLVVLARMQRRVRVPSPAIPFVAWFIQAFWLPFYDFFLRYRWHAVIILALISVYRISDVVMGIMANPFYVDMGFTKDQVATVSKIYGVIMTLVGTFVGGIIAPRIGVMRVLMLGAVLSAASNLLFAWLSTHGADVQALVLVVSADNLAGGIASAAFIAYLSSLTNVNYSATQYALFSSIMMLIPKFVAGFSGDYVNAHGYANFFVSTAALGLPVLLLVWAAGRVMKNAAPARTSAQASVEV